MIKINGIKINDALSFVALFVAFICATNGELLYTKSNLIYYLPYAVCAVALVFELMIRQKAKLSSYLTWRVLLIVFLLFSMVYAIDRNDALTVIKRYLLQSVVVILIGFKVTERAENVKLIIKICLVALVLNMIYLLSFVDLEMLAEGERLGVNAINESWNANQVGLMATFGVIFTFYIGFVISPKAGMWSKLFALALIVLFAFGAVLSGSKKAIIIILATLLLYILRSSKSHRVRNVVLAVLLLIGALYAIYNVPLLYDFVGHRFEDMLDAFFGEGGDRSSQIRQNMMQFGMEAFTRKPVLGYGPDGFANLYGAISGDAVYSHNNFVEMLVSTGLVGFVLYYGYLVKMLFTKCVSGKQTVFMKAMLIAMLVADIGLVSYYDAFYQYVLCLVLYSLMFVMQAKTETSNTHQELQAEK